MKEFTSQVCTTIEQSKRLLDLGLNPETADMVFIKELAYDAVAHCIYDADTYMIRTIDYLEGEKHRGHIPAWSLHRLMEIAIKGNKTFGLDITTKNNIDYCYDRLICDIERLINVKAFNKEYLKL